MSPTQGAATAPAKQATPPPVQPGQAQQGPLYAARAAQVPVASPSPKRAGYGLPCAKCRTYYASDLTVCPICKSAERVTPVVRPVRNAAATNEQKLPDPAELEQERERFLREFQAKMLASHPAPAATAGARCARSENHPTVDEPAAVCQNCYDQLQEKVDVLEAALHIDLKEATRIVYDAVWADTSDPNLTYQNAASALLAELRKRSGVTPTFRAQPPMLD